MTPRRPAHTLTRHRNIHDAVRSKAVITPEGCWQWTGALSRTGYGNIAFQGRTWLAHRLSYTLFHGPIPDGLDLDHLCRNRWCINPAHLEPVTNRENSLRRPDINATHCPHGHEFTEANTITETSPYGWPRRHCRECRKARQRAWHRRQVS